ncbi:MAG TPA: PDZ domain-containing protein [Pyrinomonadaceae bacterium]|nr:PDZ domain-containing protein [Pyrinomonadaceae bacterium]
MLKLFFACVLLALSFTAGFAQGQGPLLIGRVTVNRTHIAFSYAGDIWLVERGGGDARRITTDPNEEIYPVFSPDGTQLAFSRQTGGDWDVFVMPASGGEARRLTYMPEDDMVMNWSPDGRQILFGSHRDEEATYRLYTIAVDGVFPAALPLPQAFGGSYSSDGKRIAYVPRSPFGNWRYYRGGMTSLIWIANLSDGNIERLPRGNYNDDYPMWVGDKIYFISDRTNTPNLFSYDLQTKRAAQLTNFEKYGIRFASAGAGAIVFTRDGRIYIQDLAGGEAKPVEVRVNLDSSEAKPRPVNAARTVEWAGLSSSGDRVVIGARGEALVLNPASGETKNLTQSSASAERYPALSPDGKLIAYFSDESGEYQLHVRPASGEGQVKKITVEQKPTFYRELTWSPDSRKIAFTDKRLGLWYADVEAGTARRADTSQYSFQEQWYPKWSPDSRWITYSKHLKNRVRTVFIYGLEDGAAHQVTDGRTHTEAPAFDSNGRYLYFVASANAGTSEFGWAVLNGVMARPLVTRTLHALVLQENVVSPLLPNGQPNPEARFEETSAPVRIDFQGLARRVIDLPAAPRDYSELVTTTKSGTLFLLVNEWPKSPAPLSRPTKALYSYDLTKPPKFEKLVEEINGYEISRDGARLLYIKGRDWFLVSSVAPVKPDEGKLDLKGLEITVDPRAEWRQMYREAWRIMRDWFYDPNYHGQNLAELEQHFAEYLPNITRRSDLNSLMGQMLGHISVSHLAVGGGDTPPPASPPSRVGLLGCDYEISEGRYRFKRIYPSSRFNDPNGSVPSPLDRPGVNVREGEYLLAVDGQNIEATKNIYSYFEGKAGRPTKITVGPKANGEGSRQLTVYPAAGENRLRRAYWAEMNRRRVEEMSGGKLGYIFVEAYGQGIMDFIRGLTGYADKQGIIIDQRFNGGGITPDYLIEWLKRRPLYYYTYREGEDIPTPVNPGPGTAVLITNEFNGSAAETFAFMFKLGKVGPIVGARTYGAGIGPYVFTPDLIDGGFIQLPNRAAYDPSGTTWGIENIGVVPDVEVEITPRDFMMGRDPQLERAIQAGMEGLKKNVPVLPKKPKYPVHP